MTYRDEGTATAAKVDELEAKLAEANAKIAALTGASPKAAAAEGETLGELSSIGAPTSATHTIELDHTLDPAGYEAIAAVLEKRLGLRASQVGTSLTAPGDRFRLSVEGGRTRITLKNDWAAAVTGVRTSSYASGAMFGLFGGMFAAALVHDIGHTTDAVAAMQLLWAAPLGYGIVSTLWRRVIAPRTRARIEGELAAQRGTFAAITELAAQHRATPAVRARVEVDRETADETEPATEARKTERAAR